MTAEEKEALLKAFHPDYKEEKFTRLQVGPNAGEKVPLELAELLQSQPRFLEAEVPLEQANFTADVLIIGGGGAGCAAALEAQNTGASVLLVTKLRVGDANTMMAEGGIQAADKPNDSPAIHFLDAYGGGHFAAKKELLNKLVTEAPEAILWLNQLGVEFDKAPDGTMVTTHGGGTSRKRMHAAKDYSGAEIMRTLRDEVLNRPIQVVDFTAAVELILDEAGRASGAVLLNMETRQLLVARAKTVILATGGAGRMHYQGFPHLQPLWGHGGRLGFGLPGGGEASVSGYPSVPSHRRGVPSADFWRIGDGKGPLSGRHAHQSGGRSLYASPGDPGCVRRLHHPGVPGPGQGRADSRRPGRLAGYADD